MPATRGRSPSPIVFWKSGSSCDEPSLDSAEASIGTSPVARAEEFVLSLLGILRSIVSTGRDPCRIFTNIQPLHEQLLVMAHVYSYLLQGGATCTQRDVYYHLSRFFNDQHAVNKVLQQVGVVLQCPRHLLNVQAGCRGYIGGALVLDGVQLWTLGQQGMAVDGRLAMLCPCPPPGLEMDGNRSLSSQGTSSWAPRSMQITYAPKVCIERARAILIVEKDAVFQRLMAERIYEYYPCVVITGMGFPPLAVQALVRYLVDVAASRSGSPSLPMRIVGLVDYNPSGLHILLQYLRGSQRFSGRDFAVNELQWLGMRSSDMELLRCGAGPTPSGACLPAGLHPYNDRDKAMIKRLSSTSRKSGAVVPPRWEAEVSLMGRHHLKADIEAMYTVAERTMSGPKSTAFSRMIAQRIMQNDVI